MHDRGSPGPPPFLDFAADRLLSERDGIARAWLDRLEERVGVRPRRVLPTPELLDHLPRVLEAAAACLREQDTSGIAERPHVVQDLARVARLRLRQGYDVQEVIAEFAVLSRVLAEAGLRWAGAYPGTPDPAAVGRVLSELARMPLHMSAVTVGMFREQETELRHREATRVRDLLDALSHQIKTPLGAAEGAVQLLEQDDADAAERRRLVRLIGRSLARVRGTVADVLALAGADADAPGEAPAVPLEQVVREVLREVAPSAEAAGVHIEVDAAPPVQVDGPRLELVLLNLVSNAVRYADPAKPERWVRLEFAPAGPGGGWHAAVRDNGLGIPRELQARVFERFFRAHPGLAGGTGLGLAIAREAARQLGAELEMESEPGAGTTFRFTLPPRREPRGGQAHGGDTSAGPAAL